MRLIIFIQVIQFSNGVYRGRYFMTYNNWLKTHRGMYIDYLRDGPVIWIAPIGYPYRFDLMNSPSIGKRYLNTKKPFWYKVSFDKIQYSGRITPIYLLVRNLHCITVFGSKYTTDDFDNVVLLRILL